MTSNVVLPLLTCGVSFGFAIVLVNRFAHRRALHSAVWAIGLVWFAVSAAAEAVGSSLGWSPALYRIWYLSGAVGVAAYLGAGTLYLHRGTAFGVLAAVFIALGAAPAAFSGQTITTVLVLIAAAACAVALLRQAQWFAHGALMALVVGTLIAAVVIWNSPIEISALPTSSDEVVTGQAEPESVRLMTPAFNIPGAGVLILGALDSAVAFATTGRDSRRVVANVLIAAGAFVPSLTSGLTRFGLTSAFYAGQLLGVLCLLAGFTLASRSTSAQRASRS